MEDQKYLMNPNEPNEPDEPDEPDEQVLLTGDLPNVFQEDNVNRK